MTNRRITHEKTPYEHGASEGGEPEADAQGSEKKHAGGSNDGVSSANPRVLCGEMERVMLLLKIDWHSAFN